jgi:hypothetical protein
MELESDVESDVENSILNNNTATYDKLYDDEYDDTYDSQDIKLAGTIELKMLDENGLEDNENEQNNTEEIITGYVDPSNKTDYMLEGLVLSGNVEVFNISSRKSVSRQRLKVQLGMTDEQIEGWYKIFSRDVRSICFSFFICY